MSGSVILHGGALGDLVLTIQLALASEALRDGPITLLSRTDPGLRRACEPAIECRSLESVGAHMLFDPTMDTESPSILRSTIGGSVVLNALSDSRARVHQNLKKFRPSRLFSFDARQKGTERSHIVRQWMSDLRSQGLTFAAFDPDADTWCLRAKLNVRAIGVALLRRFGIPELPILIHPGSGGAAKCWALVNFIAVGRGLRESGQDCCFLVGPAEIERWSAGDMAELRAELPVAELTSAVDLAAILSAGRCLVGNDAGPAHLAALLGVPTLVLFGPTSADQWRPLGIGVTVLRGDIGVDVNGWGISADQVIRNLPPSE